MGVKKMKEEIIINEQKKIAQNIYYLKKKKFLRAWESSREFLDYRNIRNQLFKLKKEVSILNKELILVENKESKIYEVTLERIKEDKKEILRLNNELKKEKETLETKRLKFEVQFLRKQLEKVRREENL